MHRVAPFGNLFTVSCRVLCFLCTAFITKCFVNLMNLLYQRKREKSNNKGLYKAICGAKSFKVFSVF